MDHAKFVLSDVTIPANANYNVTLGKILSHMTDSFDNLPRTIQRRIDKVFDVTASSAPPTGSVERFSDYHEDTAAGGFIVDVEPDPEEGVIPTYIPFSLVPDALHRLNLPPDDDQILSVFHNAASGWSSATNSIDKSHISGGLISRDDWRSVCAVLLEQADDQAVKGSNKDDESVDEGSDYDDAFAGEESSDDDYQEEADPTIRSRGSRTQPMDFGWGAPGEYTLTKRQRETCLEAYSLFFPSVPLTDLPNKNIMIKDIQQVAKLLGEKLSADEVSDVFA